MNKEITMADKQEDIISKNRANVSFSKMMSSDAGSARILSDIKKHASKPQSLGSQVAAAAAKKK